MSFETPHLRCHECKFWWPVAKSPERPSRDKSAEGQCRRHAPPASLRDGEGAGAPRPLWALTLRDDWCGEFVHRDYKV